MYKCWLGKWSGPYAQALDHLFQSAAIKEIGSQSYKYEEEKFH